jgi:hypothetical protein
MQKAKEELYPTRTSFIHADGMPWTTTIKCLTNTWNSWKALKKRLDYFDQNLVTQVDPHTITNESLIEHGFGSQKSRGQGNLQNAQEYIQTKRLKGVDFHLKMTRMPFNQHAMSKKIFDKSYQEMDQRSLKISFQELCELFQKDNHCEIAVELTEDEQLFLNKAYALSKSVPRQSGRNRWREKAGFAPNMLSEEPQSGIILKSDLLTYCDIDDCVTHYIVQKDFKLLDVDKKVEVLKVGGKKVKLVNVGRFLTYKGMVFTVPAALYSISSDHAVVFHDQEISDFVERQKDKNNHDVDDQNAVPVSGQPNQIDFVLAGPSNVSKRSVDEDCCDTAEKRSKTV